MKLTKQKLKEIIKEEIYQRGPTDLRLGDRVQHYVGHPDTDVVVVVDGYDNIIDPAMAKARAAAYYRKEMGLDTSDGKLIWLGDTIRGLSDAAPQFDLRNPVRIQEADVDPGQTDYVSSAPEEDWKETDRMTSTRDPKGATSDITPLTRDDVRTFAKEKPPGWHDREIVDIVNPDYPGGELTAKRSISRGDPKLKSDIPGKDDFDSYGGTHGNRIVVGDQSISSAADGGTHKGVAQIFKKRATGAAKQRWDDAAEAEDKSTGPSTTYERKISASRLKKIIKEELFYRGLLPEATETNE